MTSTQEGAVRFFRPGKVVLGLAGWFLAGNLSLSAAPITTSAHKTHPVSPEIHEFRAFLRGGPGHWATSQLMAVPDGVHVRHKDGQLKDNLTVDYLMWVRDRHPLAFDHNHPRLGRQLAVAQEEWGTQFVTFKTKHDKAESIHAMTTTTTATVMTSPSSTTPSGHAQVVDPPAPHSAIVSTSGVQVFPAASHTPQLEAEILAPPLMPAISTLPPPTIFNPPISQEISTSSVVTTNVQTAPELLGPAPVPEPSSVLLALLLFAAAAGWKGLRLRGLRWNCRVAG
jgi:hypothetical protein